MSKLEDDTVATLSILFEKVNELSAMNIRELLLPNGYERYKATLDAAYDALVQVEEALDSVGLKLEYQHWRISSAFEEIKPLLFQPRSRADTVLEQVQEDGEQKRLHFT